MGVTNLLKMASIEGRKILCVLWQLKGVKPFTMHWLQCTILHEEDCTR